MATLNEIVDDFLAQKRIAVAGGSRRRHNAANMIYRLHWMLMLTGGLPKHE